MCLVVYKVLLNLQILCSCVQQKCAVTLFSPPTLKTIEILEAKNHSCVHIFNFNILFMDIVLVYDIFI